jgi:hypothetical protein
MKFIISLFVAMLAAAPAFAQLYPSPTYQNVTILGTLTLPTYKATPVGHQVISSGTLATAQSLTVPSTATYAILFVEGAAGLNGNCVRFYDDGTVPTASSGAPLQPGVIYGYNGTLATFQVILVTNATCSLTVIYYK